MAKLNRVLRSSIGFPTKHRLFRSLVLHTMLYGCEAWALVATIEKRIRAFRWNSWGSCYTSLTWNTGKNSTCGARSRALWVPGNFSVPLSSDGTWYGLAMLHGTIAYASYQAGRASSIAFVGEGDNVRPGPTTPYNGQTWQCQTYWRRLYRESGLEADFSLFCQGTDDGDDGAFICYSFQDLFVMYDIGHW